MKTEVLELVKKGDEKEIQLFIDEKLVTVRSILWTLVDLNTLFYEKTNKNLLKNFCIEYKFNCPTCEYLLGLKKTDQCPICEQKLKSNGIIDIFPKWEK